MPLASLQLRSVTNRSELVLVRDAIIRYFHHRSTLDDVRGSALEAGRSMQADGLTMEEILVVLKGAVTLAAEHVNHPSTPERAVWLRSQMTPWLVSLYLNDVGGCEDKNDG
ncbi:MAG TPA: hypothetical protein VII66_01465 [Gemmatimonadaceae bacterium]